jgi:hypothetical protein
MLPSGIRAGDQGGRYAAYPIRVDAALGGGIVLLVIPIRRASS